MYCMVLILAQTHMNASRSHRDRRSPNGVSCIRGTFGPCAEAVSPLTHIFLHYSTYYSDNTIAILLYPVVELLHQYD